VSAFVGRTKELNVLAAVAARADNSPSAAVIVGDPGSGKSRLLAEVAALLGTTSLRVVGYEAERQVPLAAAADLLRRLTELPHVGRRLGTLVFEAEDASTLEPMRVFEAIEPCARSSPCSCSWTISSGSTSFRSRCATTSSGRRRRAITS